MAVSLSTQASLIVQQLNANTSYSASVTDPRFYTSGISDAILNGDGMTVEANLANPLNGRRKDFMTSSSVAHGGQVPTHIGPIESVTNAGAGSEAGWPVSEIEVERSNPLLLNYDNHHNLMGDTLYHNFSVSATVAYCTYTRSGACQAPDEHAHVVNCLALGYLADVEGENTPMAGSYANQGQTMLAAIRSGQMPPSFQQQ